MVLYSPLFSLGREIVSNRWMISQTSFPRAGDARQNYHGCVRGPCCFKGRRIKGQPRWVIHIIALAPSSGYLLRCSCTAGFHTRHQHMAVSLRSTVDLHFTREMVFFEQFWKRKVSLTLLCQPLMELHKIYNWHSFRVHYLQLCSNLNNIVFKPFKKQNTFSADENSV